MSMWLLMFSKDTSLLQTGHGAVASSMILHGLHAIRSACSTEGIMATISNKVAHLVKVVTRVNLHTGAR